MEGEPLAQYLARAGRLPVLQGLALALQLLAAVDALHRRGAVHGRITSDRVLVSRSGQLVVPDPGERMADGQAGQRTDLLAAAVVAYELFSGDSPFASTREHAAFLRGRRDPPPPLRACRPELPIALDAVFARALARRADDRYQAAAEFSGALQAAIPTPCWERAPLAVGHVTDAPPAVSIRIDTARLVERTPALVPARMRVPTSWRVGLALAGGCAAVAVLAATLMGGGSSDRVAMTSDTAPAWSGMDSPQVFPPAPVVRADPLPLARPLEDAKLADGDAAHTAAMQRAPGRRAAPRASTPAARRGSPARAVFASAGAPSAPDLACRRDFAVAPQLCTAFQCATAEFRDHPVCVRMHAEGARARASLAEAHGGP